MHLHAAEVRCRLILVTEKWSYPAVTKIVPSWQSRKTTLYTTPQLTNTTRIFLGLFPQFSISLASPRCTIFWDTFSCKGHLSNNLRNNFFSDPSLNVLTGWCAVLPIIFNEPCTWKKDSSYSIISSYFKHSEF